MTAPTAEAEAAAPRRGRELAREVLLAVLREPERHEQRWWMMSEVAETEIDAVDDGSDADIVRLVHDCNTSLCLAGWTVVLGTDAAELGHVVRMCLSNADMWLFRALDLLDPVGTTTVERVDTHALTSIFEFEPYAPSAITMFARLFDLNLEELRVEAQAQPQAEVAQDPRSTS